MSQLTLSPEIVSLLRDLLKNLNSVLVSMHEQTTLPKHNSSAKPSLPPIKAPEITVHPPKPPKIPHLKSFLPQKQSTVHAKVTLPDAPGQNTKVKSYEE